MGFGPIGMAIGAAGGIGKGIMRARAARQQQEAAKKYAKQMHGVADEYMDYRGALAPAQMQALGRSLSAYDPVMAQMESMYGPGSTPDISQLTQNPITPELAAVGQTPADELMKMLEASVPSQKPGTMGADSAPYRNVPPRTGAGSGARRGYPGGR